MAPRSSQIAGAVLEEAVLAVLGAAGFVTLEDLDGDPSINPDKPAVTIHGRGADHQIDAVADPVVGYAFSNPARLLVEAKAYGAQRTVGLAVVRNAVGTLKDISEFWRPADQHTAGPRRYHYRYAIFASTEFTEGAQEYAYAQDIYLLPLRRSAFFLPVVEAIDALRDYHDDHPEDLSGAVSLSEYRISVRRALQYVQSLDVRDELVGLVDAVRAVRHGLIAVADRQFPIFLVPKRPEILNELNSKETVRIFRDENGWYLRRSETDEVLFSFDLPHELFELYATARVLRDRSAINLKSERLAALQAIVSVGDQVKFIQFRLDEDWIGKLIQRRHRD